MSFVSRLRAAAYALAGVEPHAEKASAVGPLISAFMEGQPQFAPRNSAAFASEAYAGNVIGYFCTSLIADAFGALAFQVFRGDTEVKNHPVLDLLTRPNPTQGGARFARAMMSSYLLSGTAYVEAVVPGTGALNPRQPRPPSELWTHRPDRFQVIPGPRGVPQAFRFRTGGGFKDFPVDALSGRGYLLQIKDFHPLSDWYGLCYSDDTEILSKGRGWLKFSELEPSDLVATRNPDTKEFEWQQPTGYVNELYSGEMLRFSSRCVDLFVTPKHRMLVSYETGSGNRVERILPAEELAARALGSGHYDVPMTSGWTAGVEVPEIVFPHVKHNGDWTFRLSGDDYCALLGAYLAEGNLRSRAGIEIAQKPGSKGYDLYAGLMTRIAGKPCHNGRAFVLSRQSVSEHFRQFGHCHEKFIPEIIRNAPRRQMQIFWDYFIAGDGWRQKATGETQRRGHPLFREALTTTSHLMASQLAELVQKLGYSVSVVERAEGVRHFEGNPHPTRRAYRLRVRYSPGAAITSCKRAAYNGTIHCVSVPNGIVFVRRNGKSGWCGNSPVEAAARWIDLGNAGATANAALMANGGNPSALFATKSNLTDPQKDQMRARLRQVFSGAENTGQPLVVGGEWTVSRLSASMADMQWTEAMHEAARNICSAFRVPHILVVPGESTYANREAADLELYDHAVLPRANIMLEDLSGWLGWLYGEDDLRLEVDIEAIPALETRREGKRKAVRDDALAGIISIQEARVEGGYGEVDKTEDFLFGPFAPLPPAPVIAAPGVGGLPANPAAPGAKPPPGGQPAAGAKPPKPATGAVPPGSKPRLVAIPGGKPGTGKGEQESKLRPPLPVAAGPLYAALRVDPASAAALAAWATDQGVGGVVDPAEMHVTTVFSRTPVPLYDVADDQTDVAYPGGHALRILGPPDEPALVLAVESRMAEERHATAARLGAAWNFPEYVPHITLAQPFAGVVPTSPPPFAIGLGPEYAAPLDPPDDKAAPADQPRHPLGFPAGGQWKPRGPDDPPSAAETAAAEALAAELLDDNLLTAELAPVLSDAADHFARRGHRTEDDGPFILGAWLDDPARHRLAEFRAATGSRSSLIGETTMALLALALARAMRAGTDLPSAVRGAFSGFEDVRVPLVATTEMVRAAGYGTQLSMELDNQPFKEWLSCRDSRVRDSHVFLDGQIVRTEDVFRYGDAQAAFPGDFGIASLDCNCRCIAAPLRSPDEAKSAPRDAERNALWHAYDSELREFEARARDAVRRGFEAQERRAVVRLHERARGAA